MIAEQNLKRAMMGSLGLAIRHIIASPPLCFKNMMPIDIIDTVRATNFASVLAQAMHTQIRTTWRYGGYTFYLAHLHLS